MTRREALIRRDGLMKDPEFAAKVANGDAVALEQIRQLAVDILGDPANFQPAPSAGGYVRNSAGGMTFNPDL